MADTRRSRKAKGRSWKVVSAFRASCAGLATLPADSVQNGIFSGLDWFPTFLAAAGNPNITDQLLKGVKLGDRTYKNHLDGYNQMACHHRQGRRQRVTKSSTSAKARSARCALTTTSTVSLTSPRAGWARRPSRDVPYLTNLRLDPFERQGWPNNGTKEGHSNTSTGSSSSSGVSCSSSRSSARNSRPSSNTRRCSKGASFNLEAVKAELAKQMAQAEAAAKGTGQ